jgi:HlyD family secretion protein
LTIRTYCLLVGFLFVAGCSKPAEPALKVRLQPEVGVVAVEKRTISRMSSQPGFIEAYEQTSIFPKVSGFIDKWNVDIGDEVTKGMELAHLDVPELLAEFEKKKSEVELDEVGIQLAEQMVKVATENLNNAVAQVDEANANLNEYEADVELRKADFQRISDLVKTKSLAEIVEDVSRKRLKTSLASREAGKAAVIVAKANEAARKADLDKARVDVEAARAKAKVAKSAERQLAALVGYTSVKAPYDGIVVARNVNTGDFVQPSGNDPSVPRSVQEASQGRTHPLYVVARTDKVRIFLDVPEMEASGIRTGSKAWITIEALGGHEIEAEVTRTSWALNVTTRTLRVEVDVPNPDRRILPNMYAYGRVEVTRSDVWAVPLEALVEIGNQTCCYMYQDGKAVLLPVQRGLDDGAWAEVSRKRVGGVWTPFDGGEQIIVGDLSQISDGEPVQRQSPTRILASERP